MAELGKTETWAPLVEAVDVHKAYRVGARVLEILRGVSVAVSRGETLAVVGASGAGKSTLLNVLGGLDRPSAGRVLFEGRDLYGRGSARRANIRATRIGFVFQAFHLLPELDLVENVMLPVMSRPDWVRRAGAARRHALELLERVGLSERLEHRPDELSGGEQQRAALARALMNDPDLILADEPTGNLDSETGARVMHCLLDLLEGGHRALVLATHNPALSDRCARKLTLQDGAIEG